MSYGKFTITEELKKAIEGRPTKIPVGLVLYLAMGHYPAIQKQLAKAFSIVEG